MATQNSQLIENLNLIYNEKLAQKTVLETTSDDFLMYHTYIAALKPSGYTSILSNGQVDVSSYKYAYVSVDGGGIVPSGSYTITTNGEYDVYNYATAVVEVDSSIPEGYVLPNGNIDLIQNGMVDVKEYAYATVAMPVPTGTVNLTENGTAIDVSQYASANVAVPIPSGYVLPSGILEINENVIAADCSSYQYVTVEVEGGGSGSSSDPWYDFIQVYEMIENEETSADYVRSTICDNFEYTEENGEYTISWDDIEEMDTGEVDQNDEPILEEKKIHVVLTGDPHETYADGQNIATALEDYEDLYYNILPILENATLTPSNDPSNDGYDYLLEGDLYAWNLIDDCGQVQQINESGFYIGSGPVGFNVNVPVGITPSGTKNITTNKTNTDISTYQYVYTNISINSTNFNEYLPSYFFIPSDYTQNLINYSGDAQVGSNWYHPKIYTFLMTPSDNSTSYFEIIPYWVDSQGNETLITNYTNSNYNICGTTDNDNRFVKFWFDSGSGSSYTYIKFYTRDNEYDGNSWSNTEYPVEVGTNSYCLWPSPGNYSQNRLIWGEIKNNNVVNFYNSDELKANTSFNSSNIESWFIPNPS